jgi:hypothetical protein
MHRGDMANPHILTAYRAYTGQKSSDVPKDVIINQVRLLPKHFTTLKHVVKARLCKEIIQAYCHVLSQGLASVREVVLFSVELSKAYAGTQSVSYARQLMIDPAIARIGEPCSLYLLPWLVHDTASVIIDSVIIMKHMSAHDLAGKKMGLDFTRHRFEGRDNKGNALPSDVDDKRVLEVSP